MSYFLSVLLGFALGYIFAAKGTEYNMLWRIRSHFYTKGMNHKAVERETQAVLHSPGLPSWASFKRLRKQRMAEDL